MRKRSAVIQHRSAPRRAPSRRSRGKLRSTLLVLGALTLSAGLGAIASELAEAQVAFPSQTIPDQTAPNQISAPAPELRIKGSNTIGAELMPAFIEGFARAQGLEYQIDPGGDTAALIKATAYRNGAPALRVSLERLGSSTSFKGLIADEADIGMSSRIIKDKEATALREVGAIDMRGDDSEHVVALDGLAVIVSPANPMQTITPQEVADVFSGKIADWSAFGLEPAPITLHARDENSGTFDTFKSLALKPYKADISDSAERYFSNLEIAKRVAADPNAIGFVPLALADSAKPLALALDCGLIVAPDPFMVKAEEYPFGRRLHLYTKGTPALPVAAEVIAFAKSDAAQLLVEQAGFVNQTLVTQGGDAFANHFVSAMAMSRSALEREELKALFQLTSDADRMSITFRFGQDGALLDSKSLNDAARLAEWIARPENTDRKIRLIGYADGLETAQARAESARRAILIHAPIGFNPEALSVHAIGSAAPVACPGDQGAQRVNRRVEAWVAQ